MESVIHLISILLGMFAVFVFYIFIELKPEKSVERFVNPGFQVQGSEIVQPIERFILLSTFDGAKDIENSQSRWYNNAIDLSLVNMEDTNYNQFFSIKSPITFSKDKVFDALDGANMKGVQASGPFAMNFANKKSNYSLTDFTIIFLAKFNAIGESAKIIEVLCNTSIKDNVYEAKAISISLAKNANDNVDITVMFGSELYLVKDINSSILINHNIMMISLSFDSKSINLYVNNTLYRFNHNANNSITLGTQPFIINKNGALDFVMYSFAYYKSCLRFDEISAFKKFMYGYMSGVDKIIEKSQADAERLIAEKNDALAIKAVVCQKCPEAIDTRPTATVHKEIDKLQAPYPSLL